MCYLMHFDLISSRIQSVFQLYFWSGPGEFKGSFFIEKNVYSPISTPGFLACVARGGRGGVGCVFHSLTRRSVNLDYSNFGQDVLWEKMNILLQKIRIKSIMASL